MGADTVQIISVICGLIAALSGFFAALAASKSAKSAHDSAQLAIQGESRALRRELAVSAAEILSEVQHVTALVEELRREYTTLFIFSGSGQHSSEGLLKAKLEDRLSAIEPFRTHASSLVTEFKGLKEASEEDIAGELAKIQNFLLQVRNHRIELERELRLISEQNRDSRERVLNRNK